MGKLSYAWAAVFLCAVSNAQFFYNDDEGQQAVFQEEVAPANTYGRDNSRSVVQHTPRQQRSNSEDFGEPINYQPAPQAPPAVVSRHEQRPRPSDGRGRPSGRREQQIAQLQPPPRVYSPSVFQNLALGMPPAGVTIPEDSFLNVLRNDGRGPRPRPQPVYESSPPQHTSFARRGGSPRPQPVYEPSPPQHTSFAGRGARPRPQPVYESSPPQHTSFAGRGASPRPQPVYEPSPPQHTSFAGRSARPRPQHVYEPSQPEHASFAPSPPAQTFRSPVSANLPYAGRPAASPRFQEIEAPPVGIRHQPQVDRSPPEPNPSPEQYQAPPAPAQVPLQPTPQRNSRRRSATRYRQATSVQPSWNAVQEEPQRPPRVFSPSVFENLGLGMAPSGVHVPEDSLLNLLRNDKPNHRTRRNQDYQPPSPVAHAEPYTVHEYSGEPLLPVQSHSADFEIPQEIQSVQPPAPGRRATHHPQQQRPEPEFVDDHQGAEEQPRTVQRTRPVQNRRRATARRHSQNAGTDPNQVELNQPQKQFAPSVFENIGLGEAPPGIYVPEDSFLNLLRGEGAVTQTIRRPVNERSHTSIAAPPPRRRQDSYEEPDRTSPISNPNQLPPQQYQNIPRQQHPQSRTEREHRRPVPQESHQPAAIPQPPHQPPKRPLQRSRSQPVSAPQPQPVYEVSEAVYNVGVDPQQEGDFLRNRAQDNNQRLRQQEHVPQRKRVNPAPRYVRPPQPVYEAPQHNYNDNPSFQEGHDVPSRRSQSANQRQIEVQQSSQSQRTDSQNRPLPPQVSETRQQSRFKTAKLAVKPLPDDVDGDQIPGAAGVDYPTLHVIPSTSFSCAQQPHNGYYADLETSCQVVHMCQSGGVQSSFLCPNGTIFNQEKFSCQWWYKVNCADAPSHYAINDRLYKVPAPPARRNKK